MPSESHPSVARAFVLAAIMSAASCGSAPSGPTPTAGPISAVTLTATLPAGALPEVRRGEMVTFTADARGGKLPLEFRFRGNGIVMRGWNTERRFTWNTTTDADGHLVGSGRIYFWVDARSSVGIETERSSDVIQFDVLDCAGFDQYTPLCQTGR